MKNQVAKSQIDVLLEIPELAQKGGLLTLRGALIYSESISVINNKKSSPEKRKDAILLLIELADYVQQKGHFTIEKAVEVVKAIDVILIKEKLLPETKEA